MARVSLDHNVPSNLAQLPRRAGHTVVEARQVGKERATDDELLLLAAQESSIFVTHNKQDFVLLHDVWCRWSAAWRVENDRAGVLVLPQPPRLPPAQAAVELNRFLAGGPLLASRLYAFTFANGWSRRQR